MTCYDPRLNLAYEYVIWHQTELRLRAAQERLAGLCRASAPSLARRAAALVLLLIDHARRRWPSGS